MKHDILSLEELAMNAHPALQTYLYDGWALRFSNGYTSRANSASTLYPSELPFEEKVAFCEQIYTARGLPTLFKLTDASPAGFEAYLSERGYQAISPTHVFTCNALPGMKIHHDVMITKEIDLRWKEDYFRLNGTNLAMTDTASAMIDNILGNVFCAKITAGGETVACGLCVEERGYAGLFDIIVDPAYRRHGFAHALCGSLMDAAATIGARSFYLSVVAQNAPAIALYKKLGFAWCYNYLYMKKELT